MSSIGGQPEKDFEKTAGSLARHGDQGPTKASNDARQTQNISTAARPAGSSVASGPRTANSQQPPATAAYTKRSSHVPSLTSNAFFRPMSSQRLQAQRSGTATSRPQSQNPQLYLADIDDASTDFGGSVIPNEANETMMAPGQPTGALHDEDSARPIQSRGTEWTEPETHGRATANTSASGHYQAGSTSESVRPLQQQKLSTKPQGMTVDVGPGFQQSGNGHPSPVRSPRSFRSSLFRSGRTDQENIRVKSLEGAEKLSSELSSPRWLHQDRNAGGSGAKGSTKVHEHFDGNTTFLMGGRWQNTKGKPINIATGIFVVVPCVLFFVFEASWLWHNVSPALPIVFAYMTYICVSSFIHASVSDPGILPRNLHRFPAWDDTQDPLRPGPPSNDWTMVKTADKDSAAMEVPVKHCRTCNIWRPPRAHHCRLCDNCIETHDHHCVWLNNCVGKRNYRYFFTFVSSASFLSLYLIGTSLAMLVMYMNDENISFGKSISHFRGPFALVIIGALCFTYPGALMGYHIYLMARGESTREYIWSHKFPKKERYRPFSQKNIIKNLMAVLCRPRPPTYYRFKSAYTKGDQRLGSQPRSQRPRMDTQGMEMEDVTRAGGFQGPVTMRQQSQQ